MSDRRPLGFAFAFGFTVLGLVGCRSDILKEQAFARPETGLAARVQVLEGSACPGSASLVRAPEHCAWPASAKQSFVMTAVVDLVAHVDADGHVDGARFVRGPTDHDFENAAVECAMQSEYRAQVDENGVGVAGETCPMSLRFARYAQDVMPRGESTFSCSPVRTFRPQTGNVSACDP